MGYIDFSDKAFDNYWRLIDILSSTLQGVNNRIEERIADEIENLSRKGYDKMKITEHFQSMVDNVHQQESRYDAFQGLGYPSKKSSARSGYYKNSR